MTVKDPTPWGTYAVIGSAIALGYYIYDAHGVNVYAPMLWVRDSFGPEWLSTLVAGAGAFGIIILFWHGVHHVLVRWKWYRVRFRNGTKSHWAYSHFALIVCTWGAFAICWALVRSLYLLVG